MSRLELGLVTLGLLAALNHILYLEERCQRLRDNFDRLLESYDDQHQRCQRLQIHLDHMQQALQKHHVDIDKYTE